MQAQHEERGVTGGVKDTRFDEEELAALQHMFQSESYTGRDFMDSGGALSTLPAIPDEDSRLAIETAPFYGQMRPERKHTWWRSCLSQCRDRLDECAIRIGTDDDHEWLLFVFAKSNPIEVTFLPLRLEPNLVLWEVPFDQALCSEALFPL